MSTAVSHRWRAYWVCVGIAALTILDLSKVNVALPSIESALGASSTELQLIISGYVLTFGLALVPAGRFGDQRSRKALFLVGLTVFTVMSVVAALAPTSTVLLIARLLQGIGAGIQMPQVTGMIQELFQGKERGKAFGLFGATIGIATAFGPTLGGLAIGLGGAEDGWRWIFWMNLPLGVLAILGTALLLPKGHRTPGRLSLDPVGILLFGVSVLALMWPFLFTTGSPDDDPRRWWMLVVFVVAATAFYGWESRYRSLGKHPLIDFGLFRMPSFRNGTLLSTAYFSALPSMFVLTSLFLQDGLGATALVAGMVTIGFALASAITSWWSGSVVHLYGRTVVIVGLVLVILGVVSLVIIAETVPADAMPWAVAAVMVVAGAGGGLVIAPNQTLTLERVPVREGGVAGSVGQLSQRIGTAIGSAIALSLFYSTIYRADPPTDRTFPDAYALGMVAVAVLLALALLAAVVDLAGRRGALAAASE